MNVLLVEDEMLARRFIRTLIDWEANGFTIAGEAANGEEAWNFLTRQPVHIVLTDIRMPRMDGFELIERIHRSGLSCEVVILSSYDDYEYVRTALKLRVSDYVHKATITEEELLACLGKARADWAKHREQEIVDRMSGLKLHNRKDLVAASLLTMPLAPDAELKDLALLEEELGIWDGGFEAALACAAGNGRGISSPADGSGAADGSGLWLDLPPGTVAVPYGDQRWILAGPRLDFPLGEEDGWIVVRSSGPIVYADWPRVYAELNGMLERRLQEAERSRSYHATIRAAVEYLREHFMEEVTLEFMSELVHVSPAYFSRLFQKEMGSTYTEYVTSIRLEQARKLLLESDLPVYDIAERVGYRNAKYFLKLFKNTHGMTPTEFRMRSKPQE